MMYNMSYESYVYYIYIQMCVQTVCSTPKRLQQVWERRRCPWQKEFKNQMRSKQNCESLSGKSSGSHDQVETI